MSGKQPLITTEEVNKTFIADPNTLPRHKDPDNLITMLAVPKSWTRLVLVAVSLLFMVVGLVSLMVYLQYRGSQANIDRIIEQQKQLDDLNHRLSTLEQKLDSHHAEGRK